MNLHAMVFDTYRYQAANNFTKARNKAILSQIQHCMHLDRDKLLSFNAVKDLIKPKNQAYKGMQAVPLNLILGSEGRYRDFNKYFLPRSKYLRERWERVDQARLRDISLPPIQLYEIGGAYFVRDGNHRVSVARTQGAEFIDAEVTSLSSEIAITPSMTTDDLRNSLIQYEKKMFYAKTEFGICTGDDKLDFSSTGQYDVIYNHILVHKYYLNQGMEGEIAFADALVSWYNTVYAPIIRIINDARIGVHFPGTTPGDLYVWIVKHWDFLKKKYGIHYSLTGAVQDFTEKYGQSRGTLLPCLAALIDQLVNKRFLKKSVKDFLFKIFIPQRFSDN